MFFNIPGTVVLVVKNCTDVQVNEPELFGALRKIYEPDTWNPDTKGLLRVLISCPDNCIPYEKLIYNIATGTNLYCSKVQISTNQSELKDRMLHISQYNILSQHTQIPIPLNVQPLQPQKTVAEYEEHFTIDKTTSILLSKILPREELTIFFRGSIYPPDSITVLKTEQIN